DVAACLVVNALPVVAEEANHRAGSASEQMLAHAGHHRDVRILVLVYQYEWILLRKKHLELRVREQRDHQSQYVIVVQGDGVSGDAAVAEFVFDDPTTDSVNLGQLLLPF